MPFDDPQVLVYVRIAYVATQAIVLGVYYFVAQQVRLPSLCSSRTRAGLTCAPWQIKKKNDQTVLKYGACPSVRSRDAR